MKSEISAYMREMQRRSAEARWSGVSAKEKRAKMSALAKARWAKVKPKAPSEFRQVKTKARTFRSKREKRTWLAALLKRLSQDVLSGKYGDDGCGSNSSGYCAADIVSDAMDGYSPEK